MGIFRCDIHILPLLRDRLIQWLQFGDDVCFSDVGGRTCVSRQTSLEGLLLIVYDYATVRATGRDGQTGRLDLKVVGMTPGKFDSGAYG